MLLNLSREKLPTIDEEKIRISVVVGLLDVTPAAPNPSLSQTLQIIILNVIVDAVHFSWFFEFSP